MRYLMAAVLVLGAMACGSPSPTAEIDAAAAPAPVAQAEAVAPEAPKPEDRATHLQLGVVYSANQMGELEPCG